MNEIILDLIAKSQEQFASFLSHIKCYTIEIENNNEQQV